MTREYLFLIYEATWNHFLDKFDIRLTRIFANQRAAEEHLMDLWADNPHNWRGRTRTLSSGTIHESFRKTLPDGSTFFRRHPKVWIEMIREGDYVPNTFPPHYEVVVETTPPEE